jgi:hypothetical protein
MQPGIIEAALPEYLIVMNEDEQKQLDEALARARAAFADKTEDEIMDDVARVIDEVRAAQRSEAAVSKTA